MFPIIPAHMLNGTPSTSLEKMALNPSNASYSNAFPFWNIWTEDFLRRKYISTTTSDCLTNHSIESMTTELKSRDSKRIKIEPKPNRGSYAIEAIPKDSKSRSFDCIDLNGERDAKCKSFISIDSSGYITNDQHYSESVWLRSLSLADDTYSHNAQLEITSDHRLRVRIVKNLVIDEEVQLWFSDEILGILAVPFFLTPANILGKNCYKCIECQKTYENPNPLKMHLATKCNRYTMDDLWSRLNSILPLKSYTLSQPISPFRQSAPIQNVENTTKFLSHDADRLRPSIPFVPSSSPHYPPIVSQSSSSSSLNPSFQAFTLQNLHQLSAFQPVPMSISPPQIQPFIASHSAHAYHHHSHHHHQHSHPHSQVSRSSIPSSSTNTMASQGEKVVAAAAAQLETIVSNMGTSKQGHICIYCGKLYSRKYGLKIHIRTHTGFKPLKCKYCLRPFGDPSNLNKHIRLHVQEKSLYKCHVCSKILVRRRDLLRHMNIKHNVTEDDTTNEGHHQQKCVDGECESDNMTVVSSANGFNETNSSRSNSVNSVNISSNDDDDDEDDDDDDDEDENHGTTADDDDFDVSVDVD
ncbi:MDS1 and EVI1 complex locus protein EVI1-B [Contarinia nasturtii]|uniref:MDS1 and EVI1 complex locus protein EVI1-B n=1 Tax=Contarinia nasturtii TaxID=265458 RepID=UPI0012D4A049|nr:MDS1 and EVI1 complex locus protein EVI1-B [Contarinia nasturtii]